MSAARYTFEYYGMEPERLASWRDLQLPGEADSLLPTLAEAEAYLVRLRREALMRRLAEADNTVPGQ